MRNSIYLLAFVCSVIQLFGQSEALSGYQIARQADRNVGSTKWSYASSHTTGSNSNKCNIFIADVFKQLGVSVPRRWGGFGGVIGAGEWGNPSSSYLRNKRCWTSVRGSPQIGDVVGDRVHVAIMTGYRTTTSAAHNAVVKNDWGFRPGQTFRGIWRYTC